MTIHRTIRGEKETIRDCNGLVEEAIPPRLRRNGVIKIKVVPVAKSLPPDLDAITIVSEERFGDLKGISVERTFWGRDINSIPQFFPGLGFSWRRRS